MGNSEPKQSNLIDLFQEEEVDIDGDSHIWPVHYQEVVEQDTMDNTQVVESHFSKVLVKEDNHVLICEKMNMHQHTGQVEQDKKTASIFQGHELEHIVHKEASKELDEDLFTNILEELCSSLDDNSPKFEVCEQHDEASYATMRLWLKKQLIKVQSTRRVMFLSFQGDVL